MSVRVDQVAADVVGTAGPTLTTTLMFAQDMGRSSGYRRRMTQVFANLMATTPANTGDINTIDANKFSQVWANVMIPFTPNFDWIIMFKYEVFPHDISYNSISSTRFNTDVAMVDSGHDQRNAKWTQPLMEFDIAYGVRTMEHLHDLIAFFRAMQGRRHAFLYKDWMDYTSTLATKTEARSAPPTTWNDQYQMTGDHKVYEFQLQKTYQAKGQTAKQIRPIYKPEQGKLKIAANGIQITNWECDWNTGKVTFISDLQRLLLANMNLFPHESIAGRWVISGANGWTAGFLVGDKIITSGWLNSSNVNSLTKDLIVRTVTGTRLEFDPQYANYGEMGSETNRNGVNVIRHPAPKTGVVITAGFHFYVPVRFDNDRLPTSLEVYGIGSAAEIKLVEVRPNEEDL